ncbi:MAG: 2-amino-4-hydroxy-6-hydroxymethyldihydropteridine diphosphokinase [Bacteroidota bacterium]
MIQYFIGLGSNIEPEKNMLRMIAALFKWSAQVDLSKIYRFAPHKIVSDQYFLNAVVRIESSLSAEALKAQLVALEETLGRDRSDPNKKIKDRTADLDILFGLKAGEQAFDLKDLQEEIYVLYPLQDLLLFLDYEMGEKLENRALKKVNLQLGELQIGEKAVSLQKQD